MDPLILDKVINCPMSDRAALAGRRWKLSKLNAAAQQALTMKASFIGFRQFFLEKSELLRGGLLKSLPSKAKG